MGRKEFNTNGRLCVVVDTTGGIADLFIEPVVGRLRAAWSLQQCFNFVHDLTVAIRALKTYNRTPRDAA